MNFLVRIAKAIERFRQIQASISDGCTKTKFFNFAFSTRTNRKFRFTKIALFSGSIRVKISKVHTKRTRSSFRLFHRIFCKVRVCSMQLGHCISDFYYYCAPESVTIGVALSAFYCEYAFMYERCTSANVRRKM